MEPIAILGLISGILYTMVYDIGKGEDLGRIIKGTFLFIVFTLFLKSVNKAYSNPNFMNISLMILIMTIFLAMLLFTLKAELPPTLQLQSYYYIIQKIYYPIIQRIPERILPQSRKEAYEMMFLSFPTRFREYLEELYEKIPDEKLKREIKKVEEIEEMPMGKHIPLVVNAKHLSKRDILPHFAFASPLIRTPLWINKKVRSHRKIWNELEVKIDKKQFDVGIYNTAGKLFLKHYYFNMERNDPREVFRVSKDIMKFLKQKQNTKERLVIKTPKIFRWVSGGALPIVKWREKYWIVTFFRHIEPVGLNIPIGSSESKNEYLSVYGIENLILREFSEEVIVLNEKPQPGGTVNQKKMILRRGVANKVMPKKFIKKHRDLRKNQDSITITDANEELIVTPITSNSEVTLKKIDEKEEEKLEGVLFVINPLEFGIEIIQPVYFEMDDNDYIIDGEIWEVENSLVRQPVVLISYEYLCKIYRENGSLGTYIEDIKDNSRDGKRLNRIPSEEYYVFAADVKLKENRLKGLRENSKEKEFLEKWLKRYKDIFLEIGDKWGDEKPDLEGDKYKEILTLCPVTWKAIELLCDSGIDKNYLDSLS